MDISEAIPIHTDAEFDAWLRRHGSSEQVVVVAIYKKSSGRQTVTLNALQATAICHGWIDNLGQRIDDERWAIRFTPRRPGSNWSDKNRGVVRKMIEEGRLTSAGKAVLPDDIEG
ncbi:MAG TPA: hypothetical protein VHM29_05695 [Acidimicrobiia bacterium]|nr:hypothetical protein [Acidimicrobiia bacterium]